MQANSLEDIIQASIKREVERIGEELREKYEREFRERLNFELSKVLGSVRYHAQTRYPIETARSTIELNVTVEMPEEKE